MKKLILILLLLPALSFAADPAVKSVNGVADSSVKTHQGVATASIKSVSGVGYNDGDTAGYSDAFSGSGALASPWAAVSGKDALSETNQTNGHLAFTAWKDFVLYYSSSSADVSEVVVLANLNGKGATAGPVIRAASDVLGYSCYLRDYSDPNWTTLRLDKNETQVAYSSETLANSSGYTIRLWYSGGHVYCSVDGTTKIDYTEASPLSAGAPGIRYYSYDTSEIFDSWTDTP